MTIDRLAVRYTGGPFRTRGRRLRATFRDLRPRRVGEPRRRSEREHATLSLGHAAVELAEPYAHVASRTFVPAWIPVTRVHARSSATRFLLQIQTFGRKDMRREASRVLFLLCPVCVRDLSLD